MGTFILGFWKLFCMPTVCHQLEWPVLSWGTNYFFQNPFDFYIWDLGLPTCLGMLSCSCFVLYLILAKNVSKASLQKCDPLSLIMALGVSNFVKMFFFNNLITTLASLVGNVNVSTHFETNLLLQVYVLILIWRNEKLMKSILHTSMSSTSKISCKCISCFLEIFPLLWHRSQYKTNEWPSLKIVSQ